MMADLDLLSRILLGLMAAAGLVWSCRPKFPGSLWAVFLPPLLEMSG
jgi:hypothetical protein